ncbi:MAG: prepilin-type N-terminal cleavage/methylation domain-containing protein [Phycisphaerales bacterium]
MNTVLRQRDRAGFSLVEVLIAVLVLGIGMLGLGAVFPAIIAEQRDSFALIEGENAAGSAEAIITNPEMVDFSFISDSFNKADDAVDNRYEYLWAVQDYGPSPFNWEISVQLTGTNFVTGLWGYDWNNAFDNVEIPNASDEYVAEIPVSARLFPQPYSGKDPKYVWDLALRREPSGDRLQAAIFVRRVDARIRVPRGESLSDVLTGRSANGTRLPVAIDPMTGRPAVDDGNGKFYANIQMLKVEVHPEHLDWLVFTDGRAAQVDTSVGFATEIGQKLVDNTGVVRTVVGAPQVRSGDPLESLVTSKRVVVVDPPFTASNAGGEDTAQVAPGVNARNSEYDDERASWVRQVIFTPRIPVAVRIVTLEEGS